MPLPKYIEALIAQKKLTADQWNAVEKEAATQGVTSEELLVEKKFASENDIAKTKSELFDLPFIDLADRDISPAIVNVISETIAENYKLVAYEKKGNDVKIALLDPANYRAIEAMDFWAKKNGYKVSYAITTPTGLRDGMKAYKQFGEEVKEALGVIEEQNVVKKAEKKDKTRPLVEIVKRAPVAQIVDAIIVEAANAGASDIHIEPYKDQSRTRFRIDGKLSTMINLPITLHASIISRIKVLANLKIDETRIPQDGRIRQQVDGGSIDLRISTMPVLDHEKVAMRLLPVESQIVSLGVLGFWKKVDESLTRILERPTGVLLISGPTGSGKTTTLYSMLRNLNKEDANIITLEDPVEYFLSGVNQVQINAEVGLTFASGLRAVLRQDPNIVMVGEVRDRETAELAIQAALTGHFMLSTIHAKDVIGVIPRLIDMGVEPFLISAALNAILAQRLVRKICENCKESVSIPAELEKDVRKELAEIPKDILGDIDIKGPLAFYRGKGCTVCGDTGYKGRTVVSEMIIMTNELRELVRTSVSFDVLRAEMDRQGMITLKQDGILKALHGFTTMEEILLVTRD